MRSLTKTFGGLNNRLDASLIGPNLAQDLANVNLDSQGIKALNGPGASLATGAGTQLSLHKFNGHYIVDTIAWQYVEYGGMLYRAATGHTPQKTHDGVTWYNLGIVNPVTGCSAADSGAGSGPTGALSYYVTFVSQDGEETGPSPAVNVTGTGFTINLTSIEVSADPQVTHKRIYRSGDVAGTLQVTEITNATTTYNDSTAAGSLGVALTTAGYAPPPQLDAIAVTPYGIFLGISGSTLVCSEQALPYAWKATSSIPFNETLRAVVPYAGYALILSKAKPYLMTGNSFDTFSIEETASQQGCVARDTAIKMGDKVFYLSPDGLCTFPFDSLPVLSKGLLSDDFMAAIVTTGALAVQYNERYLLFHSAGFLEFDIRTSGSPWKKGTVVVTAAHYSPADDALYVAEAPVSATANVCQWEAGSALTYSYQTGDWTGEEQAALKSYTWVILECKGAVTISAYVDGNLVTWPDGTTTRNNSLDSTLTKMGRWYQRLPLGCNGRRISVKLTGTGNVIEVLEESVTLPTIAGSV